MYKYSLKEIYECFIFQNEKTGDIDIWFKFQKTKYVYDYDKKSFGGLQFPENQPFKFYQEWKGFADESELLVSENKYGKNE